MIHMVLCVLLVSLTDCSSAWSGRGRGRGRHSWSTCGVNTERERERESMVCYYFASQGLCTYKTESSE